MTLSSTSKSHVHQCDSCGYEAPRAEFTVVLGRRLCSFCACGVPTGRKTYREHASDYARGGAVIVGGFTRGY